MMNRIEINIKQLQTVDEIEESRRLYEEVFSEDTEAFISYYYEQIANNNVILGGFVDGKLISMLHMNPYTMCIGSAGQTVLSYYIVAVATKEAYRSRGCMKALILNAMYRMREEGCLFTYLMPAHPAIYEPYQFTYIYNRYRYKKNLMELDQSILREEVKTQESLETLLMVSRQILAENYDLYTQRDRAYYQRLYQEIKLQNGGCYLFWINGKPVAYMMYVPEQSFVQEFGCLEAYRHCFGDIIEIARRKPIIMGRILEVERFSNYLQWKEDAYVSVPKVQLLQEVMFAVRDESILENNGCFRLERLQNGKKMQIKRVQSEIRAAMYPNIIETTIEKMTQFLFGYRTAKECFPEVGLEVYTFLNQIKRIENPYINEAV